MAEYLSTDPNAGAAGGQKYLSTDPNAGATDATAPKPERSATGFVTGNVNKGLSGMLGLPVDTARNLVNLIIAGTGAATQTTPDLIKPGVGSSEWFQELMGKVGMIGPSAEPTSGPERIAAGALQGAGGALAGPGRSIPMLARQIVGGAAAGTGAATGGEAFPDTPAAAIIGGMLPSVPGAIPRPPSLAPDRISAKQRQFADAGVENPSLGLVTGNKAIQGAENVIGASPGGAGRMLSQSEQRIGGMGKKVTQVADELAPDASAERAGRTIQTGIEEGFIPRFQAKQRELWDKLDTHVQPGDRIDVTNTQQMLDTLTGAKTKTGQSLVNPKVREIADNLKADLGAEAPPPELAGLGPAAQAQARAQLGTPPTSGMTYEGMKDLRSRVGEMLGQSELVSDIPRTQLKRLYSALTRDMESAFAAKSPQARADFDRANAHTRAGHERIDSFLDGIAGKATPEQALQSALSGSAQGGTKFRAIMRSLEPEERKVVSSHVLREMGKAKAGAQGAEGSKFSPDQFVTNWNNLDPSVRSQLFPDAKTRASMEAIAASASDMKQAGKVFVNPSGTAQMAGKLGVGTTALTMLLTGNFGPLAGIAAGVGGNRALAQAFTSPTFINWLAKAQKANPEQQINMARNLAVIANKEPALQPIAELVNQQQDEEPPEPLGQVDRGWNSIPTPP